MFDCKRKALSMFERILELGSEVDGETYWSTKRQKNSFYERKLAGMSRNSFYKYRLELKEKSYI